MNNSDIKLDLKLFLLIIFKDEHDLIVRKESYSSYISHNYTTFLVKRHKAHSKTDIVNTTLNIVLVELHTAKNKIIVT